MTKAQKLQQDWRDATVELRHAFLLADEKVGALWNAVTSKYGPSTKFPKKSLVEAADRLDAAIEHYTEEVYPLMNALVDLD